MCENYDLFENKITMIKGTLSRMLNFLLNIVNESPLNVQELQI